MIRHHDEISDPHSLAIEVHKRINNLTSCRFISQDAGSQTAIEFNVHTPAMPTFELCFPLLRQRFIGTPPSRNREIAENAVRFQPDSVLLLPAKKNLPGNRVSETKCDEIRGIILSPMREISPIDSDWRVRVKSLKGGILHDSIRSNPESTLRSLPPVP